MKNYFGLIQQNRKAILTALVCVGFIAIIFASITQSSGASEQPSPIDPDSSDGLNSVLAGTLGIEISTPVSPEDLTGLGYHPNGESLLKLSPRGKNLSGNALLSLLGAGGTPEDIQYYVMDKAGRDGPRTGALDVGSKAGSEVYAPVSGVVTAIRPDPTLQSSSIVEIKPNERNDVRVYVSLVQDPSSDVGPSTPVTAGKTRLGSVADSAAILDPQLSTYTDDPGNHVTVFALQVG